MLCLATKTHGVPKPTETKATPNHPTKGFGRAWEGLGVFWWAVCGLGKVVGPVGFNMFCCGTKHKHLAPYVAQNHIPGTKIEIPGTKV